MKTFEKVNFNIEDIRNEIKSNIAKHIKIKEINKAGKKIKEYLGEIIGAYDNLFVVKVNIKENEIFWQMNCDLN